MTKLPTRVLGSFFAMACVAIPSVAASELTLERQSFAELRPALSQQGGIPSEMYSFTDVYRLTVAAALPEAIAKAPSAPELLEGPAVRAVASAVPRLAETRFLIHSGRDTQGWLLALTGLVFAGWLATRRLGYPQA